jgi:hypothetical protein
MLTFLWVFCVLITVIFGLASIFLLFDGNGSDGEGVVFIICLLIAIFFGFMTHIVDKKIDVRNNANCQKQIEMKQYQENADLVNGVYSDRIITNNDGVFYINTATIDKNITDFKPNDAVKIKYVTNGDKKIIIYIEKLSNK